MEKSTIQVWDSLSIRNILHSHPIHQWRSGSVLWLGIEQAKEHRFEHLVQEVFLHGIVRPIEKVVHVVQIATQPSLTLQEVKEHDTTHHLLDVVAHLFLVLAKGCKELGIRLSNLLLHPLIALLDIYLTRQELHKLGILLTILIEENIGKSLNGEGVLDLQIFICPLLQIEESRNRSFVISLLVTKNIGKPLGIGSLSITIQITNQ